MFICLVGQTPITALADGDDTRVISVPEGLQELLINEIPEIQTEQTADTTEYCVETQNDETNEVVSEQPEVNENNVVQPEEVTDTNETQPEQGGDIDTNIGEAPVAQNEEPIVQNEVVAETSAETQTVQNGNATVETPECIEQTVDANLPQGVHNYGDIVRVSGLLPKDAIVEAIPVNVEIEGQSVLLAYDITIYENEEKKNAGISWQPDENGLSVEFISIALEETEEEVNIWHMEDVEETPEYVTAAPSPEGSVEFMAESFSVYVVTETKLTATIVASDGNTYEINVTYDNKSGIPMEGTTLKVEELKPGDDGYDEYIEESASKVGANTEDFEFSKVFDIKIVDENNETIEYEPTGDVDVSIRVIGVPLSDYENVNVIHFVEDKNDENILVINVDLTVNGETVEFTTKSFSVYSIVAAKENPVLGAEEQITSLSQIEENQAYYFSIVRSGTNYMTVSYPGVSSNFSSGEGEFIGSTVKGDAGLWYFEESAESGKYYIYTKEVGTPKYLYVYNTKLLGLDENQKTAFSVANTTNNANTFYINIVSGGKNYALSVRGNKNFFLENRNNGANANERVIITKAAILDHDHFELDGKTFSITYYEEGVKGAGLSTVSGNKNLNAIELLVRPDVLNSTGELLIANGTDLPDWKFEWIERSKYYITTQIGGTKYYLTLGNQISLVTSPTEYSKINVESGTDDFSGKYKFTAGGNSLTLSGGKVEGGFVSTDSSGNYCWMTLATKSPLLDDDDFIIYSAEKVDLSDRSVVPDGAEVVLYTRKWNDTTKKYEYYAVNYDGSLVRAFESGGLIQWVGSTINTMVWDFTEYLDNNGDPNYYYQLKNKYPGGAASNIIRPSVDGSFLRTESSHPNYFERSINLNGRRYGYYYSTILAWDDPSYAYMGLRVKDDCSGIEVCPMDEADTFYFAIMTQVDPTLPNPTTVETIDHTQYGITMKMVDFTSRDENNDPTLSSFLGSEEGGAVYTTVPNLLSTNLGSDGYPCNDKGDSLKDVFENRGNGLKEVNHLFIKNTYYSSGYYEFDSTQNFASFFDENGNIDINNFTVYNELGTNDNKSSNSMKHGQFLPYNALSVNPAIRNPYNLYSATVQELPDSDPRKHEQLRLVGPNVYGTSHGTNTTDYHFAVEIEATFTQTANGLDAWGHDIIYEFTGDDDFWLYVDGELIIDLGGIHSALPGSVNYSTGEVSVNGKDTTLYELFYNNYKNRDNHTDAEAQAYVDGIFKQNDNGNYVFKDYTDHTMRIFFMERGAGASNLHMRFNLASVKPGTVLLSKEIEGVDSTESYMSEYPFQIFYKETQDGLEIPLIPGLANISVVYKDTNRSVTFDPSYTSPDGKVYENVFILKPGEIAEIDFPDQAVWYDIQECAVHISEIDTTTTPNYTVHQGIYLDVKANGESLTGVDNGQGEYRKDYRVGYAEVKSRGRVTFQNVVDPNAKGNLTFVKHLYDESGTQRIYNSENDTTFTFRLYLGTENTPSGSLPPADMYSYHVKDENGNYCKWDSAQGKLISLGSGMDNYSNLSDAQKRQVTFTTSMNGSIANIPVDYTVEIREIPAGTKYKVEERESELPDGYSLKEYVTNVEGVGVTAGPNPASGIINVAAVYNHIEIHNLKGWGLRCYKDWSDVAWMDTRDEIYMAVYKDNNGTLEFVDNTAHNTVRRVKRDEDSAYWFFDTIDDLDGNGIKDALDFEKYVVREVIISNSNPTVESETGKVSDYGTVTPLSVDGTGNIDLYGKQYGDTAESLINYTITDYSQGALMNGSNVRIDRITNKRAGVDIYATAWDGATPLSGAVFTLKDGNGNDAVESTLRSDSDGLITIAYLRENEIYTLTETASPAGYLGPDSQTILKIRRNGNDISYSTDGGTTWTSTIANSEESWFIADDTDVTTGADIRTGKAIVKNKPYVIKIKKTQQTADGDPLPGATFALYRQVTGNNGQPRKDYQPISGYNSLVSESDGFIPYLTNDFADGTLIPGTYYLHETYPVSGYQPLSEDIVFTISPTGKVTLDSYPAGVELSTDNIISVPNMVEGTTEFTVKKVVENGTTADENGTNRFNFTVKLYLPDGHTPWPYSDANGDFENATASFSLGQNGEKELIVPLGAVVEVKETPVKDYYTTDASMDVTTSGETTTSTCDFNTSNLTSTVTIKDETAVTLTYTNTRKTVNVMVNKKAEGAGGNFTFTVTLKDGTTLCKNYTVNNNETDSDSSDDIVTNNSGKATFNLSPAKGQTVNKVLTIPYGTEFSIEETDPGYPFTTTVKIDNGSTQKTRTAVLAADKTTTNHSINYINKAIYVAPSGVSSKYAPYALIFLTSLALIGGFFVVHRFRRRREEEE
ncbi:fibro-slime domain-containing protein [Lachnospiraceae bacterium G41]|nr:fibro-slime domain-containing protein [Lachnospiraceae bacterium G41]